MRDYCTGNKNEIYSFSCLSTLESLIMSYPSVTEIAENLASVKLQIKEARAEKGKPAKKDLQFIYQTPSGARKTFSQLTFIVEKVSVFFKYYPADPANNKQEMHRMVVQFKDSEHGEALKKVLVHCEALCEKILLAKGTPDDSDEKAMLDIISTTKKEKGIEKTYLPKFNSCLLYGDAIEEGGEPIPQAVKKLWKFVGDAVKPGSSPTGFNSNAPTFLIVKKTDIDPEDPTKFKLTKEQLWNKEPDAKTKNIYKGTWTSTAFRNDFAGFWEVDQMTVSIPFPYKVDTMFGLVIIFKDIAMYRNNVRQEENNIIGDQRYIDEDEEETTPNQMFSSNSKYKDEEPTDFTS